MAKNDKEKLPNSSAKEIAKSSAGSNKKESNNCTKPFTLVFLIIINSIIFGCVIFLTYMEYKSINGCKINSKKVSESDKAIESLEQKILAEISALKIKNSAIKDEEKFFSNLSEIKNSLTELKGTSSLYDENRDVFSKKEHHEIVEDARNSFNNEIIDRLMDEVDSRLKSLIIKNQKKKDDFQSLKNSFLDFYEGFFREDKAEVRILEAKEENTIQNKITETFNNFVKVEKIDNEEQMQIETLEQAKLYFEARQVHNFILEIKKIDDLAGLNEIVNQAEVYIKEYEGFSPIGEIEKISFLIETYKESN